MEYKLENLEEMYYLELDKIIETIKEKNVETVLLQLPDGLKPWGPTLIDYLEEKTSANFMIWLGTCYGACDTPVLPKDIDKKVDLVIQFGHSDMMPSYL